MTTESCYRVDTACRGSDGRWSGEPGGGSVTNISGLYLASRDHVNLNTNHTIPIMLHPNDSKTCHLTRYLRAEEKV